MAAGRPKNTRQLALCREEGITCHECVKRTASDLIQISAGLDGAAARQLFQIMYPESACAAMAPTFAQLVTRERGVRIADLPPVEHFAYQMAVA